MGALYSPKAEKADDRMHTASVFAVVMEQEAKRLKTGLSASSSVAPHFGEKSEYTAHLRCEAAT